MKYSLKTILKHNEFFKSIYTYYLINKHKKLCKNDPIESANFYFKKKFNKDIDLVNPQNLIEKIYWMQFFSDTSLWSVCSDKYLVRNYIEKCGYGHFLNRLYGHYTTVEDIDFDALPKEFVLKSNNATGTVILVKDKDRLNIPKTKKILKKWLKYEFGYFAAQFHYLNIMPCIIAEELLHNKNDITKSLIDYKFTCFNGVVESIQVHSERNVAEGSYLLNLYDREWNDISDRIISHKNDKQIAKPESFDNMLKACMKIGQNIPYVRIDFYEVDSKPIFGEMTFTTAYDYFTNDYYDYLGSKINISEIKKLSNTITTI